MAKKKEEKEFQLKIGVFWVKLKNYTLKETVIIIFLLSVIVFSIRFLLFR